MFQGSSSRIDKDIDKNVKTKHYPNYLDHVLMDLPQTLTAGVIFWRPSKQGVTALCFE